MGSGSNRRHLIFLVHLWLCMPFALFWSFVPEVRVHLTETSSRNLLICIGGVFAYLIARTYLAFRPPAWLQWDFVYPPIDVAIVSLFLYTVDSNPLSNIALLYFLPIAEAAQTLNWRWSAAVALMVIAGSILGSIRTPVEQWSPFNVVFRFFFLAIISSLLTMLAKHAADIRSQLRVEADRNRLALEMHDGLQGSLITAASQMELVHQIAASDSKRAAEVASQSRDTVRKATDELRYLVQRLRTRELVGGFEPALRQYASNICERNQLELEFRVEGEPYKLRADVENALFRVAQEALTNILRHAHASAVQIDLEFGMKEVSLAIQDNGSGFTALSNPLDHAGLEGMRMRVQECGGIFKLGSDEEGTRIEVSVPRK
ncbi:MAG TPA: sensor histidine kinase [Fimbriimonadaceae bacterium]|nr:sensor histidine kinase [Fimbriimonadaceae bacterium]